MQRPYNASAVEAAGIAQSLVGAGSTRSRLPSAARPTGKQHAAQTAAAALVNRGIGTHLRHSPASTCCCMNKMHVLLQTTGAHERQRVLLCCVLP